MSLQTIPYLYQKKILDYKNNAEYRLCIRQLFQMDSINYQDKIKEIHEHIGDELDLETRDELEFDDIAMEKGLNFIYDKTKNNPLFQELYSKGAARMFSTDPEIGLAICCSYDYFYTFHHCLMSYLDNPDSFQESNEIFKKMIFLLS